MSAGAGEPKPRRKRAAKPAAKKPAAKPRAGAQPAAASGALARDAAALVAAGVAAGVVSGAQGLGAGIVATGRGLWWLARQRFTQRLVAIAVLAGALVGTSRLVRERVEAFPQLALAVRFEASAEPPPGLSAEAADDLARVRLPARAHAFDARVVPGLASHLARLPWVAEVQEVALEPPQRLRFALRTRRPFARLRSGEAVDEEGVTFPARYAAEPDALPELAGLPAGGAARVAALRAGAQVLADLGPLAAQVQRVDLTNLGGVRSPRESEVVLELAGGLRVDWGRPGTDDRPCRAGEEKREDLEAFLAAFPQLGAIERLSVRWDKPTYVLRAQTAQAGQPVASSR
ncbi:MAG: cell division protein FtsQ/DivIB [Planctomycetota bacterium]